MFVAIEKSTGKIVWAESETLSCRRDAEEKARSLSKENPGRTYYGAFLYLEVTTGVTTEKHKWAAEREHTDKATQL